MYEIFLTFHRYKMKLVLRAVYQLSIKPESPQSKIPADDFIMQQLILITEMGLNGCSIPSVPEE